MYLYVCMHVSVCTYDAKGFPMSVTFLFLPSCRQPSGIWAVPEPSVGPVGEATEEPRLAHRPEYVTRHVNKRADQGVDVEVRRVKHGCSVMYAAPIVFTQIILQDSIPGLELFTH